MTNFFIQQWAEAVKTGTKMIKDAMETDNFEFQNFIGTFWNLNGFAQIGKAYLDSDNELNKTSNSVLNSMLRSFLESMDMKATANAVKELNDIRADSIGRLVKNYQDWVNIFWSSGVNQLESLKNVTNYQEAAAVVLNELPEMQEKIKDNVMDSIQVWTGIETATKTWTTRMIDSMAAQTSAAGASAKTSQPSGA
jgi:hypothetical protein